MKRIFILALGGILFLCILVIGCNQLNTELTCPTKYIALAENEKVTGNPTGGVKLFEINTMETKCYKELRIFVHVMNDHYETNPFPANSYMTITAFHGIGIGSWGYYTDKFTMKYTSEFHGFSQIPVIGEEARLVVFGYNMPDVELKIDVAAYLVK